MTSAYPPESYRVISLTDGGLYLVATARGPQIYKVDALHSLLLQHMDAQAAAFWALAGPQKVVGWINRKEKEVVTALAERGILVWQNKADRCIRLIDTNWLTTHAAIREFVTGARPPGKRCRFCRVQEIGTSLELVPVEPETRNAMTAVNGIQILQPSRVYCHAPCVDHWHRWLTIAKSYKSQEEAEAADKAAGRTASTIPALPGLPPQEPSSEFPHLHGSGKDALRDPKPSQAQPSESTP